MLRIAAMPLTGAGLGLLMWSGMTTALLQLRPGTPSTLHQLQLLGLLSGWILVAAGTLAGRADRVPPGVPRAARRLRLATLAGAALLCVLLALAGSTTPAPAPLLVGLGLLSVLAAFGTVAAMAHGFAGPAAPAPWRQPLVLPVQLLLAMSTGLALLYVLMDRLFVSGPDSRTMLATLTGLGVCLALCKGLYWRAVDRMPHPGAAVPAQRTARIAMLALAAGAPALTWLLALSRQLPSWLPLLLAACALGAAAALEHRLFLGEGAGWQREAGHES
ncbi:hypothetical protein [Luteimonas sp. 9C]|uniref:hypothetical protein n=1 Tax=Luteimonas sp. 9C TaxID=2653148 RepID=UPI00135A0630|nr:hypothetical protein [Luteimonas sp. 9C]